MIASMTGYGKADFADDNLKITVEIKSINSKQLDLTIRMPTIFREQETNLRNIISPSLERGKVEVCVSYENKREVSPVRFNVDLIEKYKNSLTEISRKIGAEEPKEWLPVLLRLPDTMSSEITSADDAEKEALIIAARNAVALLWQARLTEGRGLYHFFFEKIERIRGYLVKVEGFEKGRIAKIREKLLQQLEKLQGVEIDRGRLEQELIFYIEKLDVTEEKQRLRSHLTFFEETLGDPEETFVTGKGKKLGFIAQEIGREINTLGSKSNDADMQKLVVMMKDELEQIKEQVLNVL